MGKYMIVAGFTLFLLTSAIHAQEEDAAGSGIPEVSAQVEMVSRYLWRGLALSEGSVIQPSLSMSVGNLQCSVWSNIAFDHTTDLSQLNEVDLHVSTSREVGGFSLEPSLQLYTFPNQEEAPTTVELRMSVAREIGFFTFSLAHNVDILEYGGASFSEGTLALDNELVPGLAFGGMISLGFGPSFFTDVNYALPVQSVQILSGQVSCNYAIAEILSIQPYAGFARILNEEVRSQVEEADFRTFGVIVGVTY